jgi:single-stranded-DNA-specific exonuclease
MSRETFLAAIKDAADRIDACEGEQLIIADLDADGIAGAAILASALERLGKPYQVQIVPHLTNRSVKRLAEKDAELIILVDIGATHLKEISSILPEEKLLLVDHHYPDDLESPLATLNPANHEMDGSKDICSATMAYFLAEDLDTANEDLTPLALVGIIADAQEKDGFQGLNEEIVMLGKDLGLVEEEERLKLFGYERRSVLGLMIGSHDLKIEGVTGDPEGAKAFLQELGIPLEGRRGQTRYWELSDEQKELLFEEGKKRATKEPAVAPYYSFPKERGMFKDARQYSTLLNACGRLEKANIGIAICMGDESARRESSRFFATIASSCAMPTSGSLKPNERSMSSSSSSTLAGISFPTSWALFAR